MRTTWMVVALVLAVGCSDATDDTLDDGEAESGEGVTLGKADAEAYAGLYRWTDQDRPYWKNDIPAIQLRPAHYVRTRCYGRDCAKLVPQFGDLELVRTSAGKKFLRFMSYERVWEPVHEEWQTNPVVADTYEIKKTRSGIKLRKTYSSRWFSLARISEQELCTGSGGWWDEDAGPLCTCDELNGADWSHYIGFFPGLGGCFEVFAADEDECSSTGQYTDDDATPIGTYCRCPVDTYETLEGCQPI
jgi:hypothetical protein